MLEVANVSKTYPTPRGPLVVLQDVAFSLTPGQSAAITGPSGSGKSSLLYILGALEAPTTGTVTLGGTNPFTLTPSAVADFRNSQIGFVFQDHCLLPQLSVLENVLVPTFVAGTSQHTPNDPNRNDAAARARALAGELIDQVGLSDRIDHRPAALSGGEKQRAAIARALIRQPGLVLCDEPTGNLDPSSAGRVADLLLDLHRHHQMILVVVTHSADLAARMPIRFELNDRRLRRVDTRA